MKSSSMMPTIALDAPVTIEKLAAPKRGDVIVFAYPCNPDVDFIMRVAATAGQSVEVRCDIVYVDGVAVPSKLADGATSRYHETVGGESYDTLYDPDRPRRDMRLADGTLTEGDRGDFPTRGRMPSCSQADPPTSPAAQVHGMIVETKPDEQAKACEQQRHYVVPDGHVFVLGDNRFESADSRIWGAVPIQSIKGRARFR
jgi:signal peptidase I